jgi:uncharacterized protein YcfJ
MRRLKQFLASAACAILLVASSGCSTTESSTGYGAAAGAGAGALIGGLAGGSDGWWIGALAGSAVGAASGYLIGSQIEENESEEQRRIAEQQEQKDANVRVSDNSKREQAPRYYAYEVSPGKYMIYDNDTKKYWKGVYAIPDAHKGSVAKVDDKWVEVR